MDGFQDVWSDAITLEYNLIFKCKIFSEVPEVTYWHGTFTSTVWPGLVDGTSRSCQSVILCYFVHNNQYSEDSTIWLTIPFVSDLTTQLVKKLNRELRRCLDHTNVDIQIKQNYVSSQALNAKRSH